MQKNQYHVLRYSDHGRTGMGSWFPQGMGSVLSLGELLHTHWLYARFDGQCCHDQGMRGVGKLILMRHNVPQEVRSQWKNGWEQDGGERRNDPNTRLRWIG
jgi:hypothetical protein